MKRVRSMLGAILVGACSSSSPTTPSGPQAPNIAGSWLDSTDFNGQVDLWNIAQHEDSVEITSPAYYLRSTFNGNVWWGREGVPHSAPGVIAGDSILLCDPTFGPPCPDEIAYLRGNTIVLYLAIAIDGKPADSAFTGVTYARGAWTTGDTIPPLDAPPPVAFAGGWASDSLDWAPQSCSGIIQIGLAVTGPLDTIPPSLYLPGPAGLHLAQEWVRQCGTPGWGKRSFYLGFPLPIPCTPADGCVFVLLDTIVAVEDNWFLAPASGDSLFDITSPSLNTGWRPPYFLRDSSIASLARVSAPIRRMSAEASRAQLLALRRRRQLGAMVHH
jgi:hypothetical protein